MKVWDVYTRLWHWLLLVGIVFQWLSAEVFDDQIQNHALMGYALLGMMLFRISWGLIGPESVRFKHFIPSWNRLTDYLLRKNKITYVSHNPLGAFAVLAFIVVITIQALSGLFMDDDIFFTGPLYNWLSTETTAVITEIHDIGFAAIQLLIVLHIIGVLIHRYKGEPFIIKAMVTGNKPIDNPFTQMPAVQLHLRAWISIALSILTIWLLVNHVPTWLGVEADYY